MNNSLSVENLRSLTSTQKMKFKTKDKKPLSEKDNSIGLGVHKIRFSQDVLKEHLKDKK